MTKPRNIDPASPMKTLAGWKLKTRKATHAPARAAAMIAGSARPREAARMAKVVAPSPVMPAARPSMPSLKLIMFTIATNQRIVSGYWAGPRSPTPRNGQGDVVDGQPRRDRDRGAGHLAHELDGRGEAPDVVDRAEGADQHRAGHQRARRGVGGQEVEHRHQEAREDRETAQARRGLAVDAPVRGLVDGPDRPRQARGQRRRGEHDERRDDGAECGDEGRRHGGGPRGAQG